MKTRKYTYYNEHDPNAAEWIRQLIKLDLIPQGEVDERSIVDVDADSIKHFQQWHFFSGIAVWAYALRQAGWDDDREIMSGSCPCQSFSAAGSQRGFDDDRHLWPHMFRIVQELRPRTIIGEQVSSKLGYQWWDIVAGDLESEDYAATALDLPGGCVGAYHRRYRFFWAGVGAVGFSSCEQRQFESIEQPSRILEEMDAEGESRIGSGPSVASLSSVDNPASDRLPRIGAIGTIEERWQPQPKSTRELSNGSQRRCDPAPLGHSNGEQPEIDLTGVSTDGDRQVRGNSTTESRSRSTAIWDNTHWLQCSDGKYRAADRDIYPLAGVVGMDKPRIRYKLERGLYDLLPPGHAIERTEEIEGIAKLLIDSRNWGAVKSSTLKMANGLTPTVGHSSPRSFENVNDTQEARGMRLKGYGNAIVAPLAVEFIRALMEII